MKKILAVLAGVGGLALAGPAAAATTTLEGGATDAGTHLQLVSDLSDASTANDFSAVAIAVPENLKFKDVEVLATQFNVTDDGCAGGSPRYQIGFGDKNLHVYLGALDANGAFQCAAGTWLGTGNLVGSTDKRFDLTQFGGPFYGTYGEALALLGEQVVTSVRLAVDGGWAFADKEQTVLARNLVVDGVTVVPTGMNPAQTCKALRASMGAEAFRNAYGTNRNKRNAFGKCVSAMARQKATERREVANAALACKAERAESAAAFRAKYRSFGKCVAAKSGTNPTAAPAASKAKGKGNGKGRRP